MLGQFENHDESPLAHLFSTPLVRLSLCWILGIILGAMFPSLWLWSGAAFFSLLLACAYAIKIHTRAAAGLVMLSGVFIASAWLVVQRDYTAHDDVARFIQHDGSIVKVTGQITSTPRDVVPGHRQFGDFNIQNPGTLFELKIDQIDAGQGWQSASGSILVRIRQHDHRPMLGQRIEAIGWLSAIGPTQNSGEFDYRAYLAQHGVAGRMTLMRRGNWREIDPPPRYTLTGIRRRIGDAALNALHTGLPHDPQRTGLLDALLLGRRSRDIDALSESFRQIGLAHVLAISGAHLAILLMLVWWIGRLLIARPAVVSWIVFAVLILFLLAVPWRTPIIRAAIMAAVFCVGHGLGRRLAGIELLACASLIVLIFKPTDLFDAGFQLSFGVVAALIVFAKPVSYRLLKPPLVVVVHPTLSQVACRAGVDLLAVSLVAFAVSAPLAMYHFQLISPMAMILSMLALIPLTGMLGLGYLKILVGLASPTASSALAMPLAVLADSLSTLVEQSQHLPGTGIELVVKPSVAWTMATLLTITAFFAGMFRTAAGRLRLPALGVTVLLVVGWGYLEQHPSDHRPDTQAAMIVTAFSVGDGSCYLIQSQDKTIMFDCGSQNFMRIGERSIVPALHSMGVDHIDILFLSHADMDHYVGVLDVADRITIGRVLVSPEIIGDAEAYPDGPTARLLLGLESHGLFAESVEAGWAQSLGEFELEVLWPAPAFTDKRSNNHSLVLSVKSRGRRAILCGDIEDPAMDAMLNAGIDLNADLCDLAHHGSFDDRSADWLAAVSPRVVLQSSGYRHGINDPWQPILSERNIQRLATDDLGMIRLTLMPDGSMHWQTHRDGNDPGRAGVLPAAHRED